MAARRVGAGVLLGVVTILPSAVGVVLSVVALALEVTTFFGLAELAVGSADVTGRRPVSGERLYSAG